MKPTRLLALTAVVGLIGALAGCDVFMASKLGRWNPLDPDNERVGVSKTLSPVVDGYVQDVAPERNFSAPSLMASEGYTGNQSILLVFADVPVSVDSALLQLDCRNGSGWVDVYPIGRAWSPDSVDYPETLSAEFIDYAAIGGGDVQVWGLVTLDVTEVARYMAGNGNYGMILKHYGTALEFARGPKLIIDGKDIPE
jgi:hypothetical protein